MKSSSVVTKRLDECRPTRVKAAAQKGGNLLSWWNDLTSFATTSIRLGRGIQASLTRAQRPAPNQLLVLYEFEACPYCRKVREVLTELDLDYHSLPVAEGSPRRSTLKRKGGKLQVPFLIDPNTRIQMYESADIVAYLWRTYGNGAEAAGLLPLPIIIDNALSGLASAWRLGRGARCRVPNSRRKLTPLELFNMEGSPYCRKVREVLSELDLEHVVRNVPKGSPQREQLARLGGKVQVPFLIDPNTKISLYESEEIIAYLLHHYGARPRSERYAGPRA